MTIKKKAEKKESIEDLAEEFIKSGGKTPLEKKESEEMIRFTLRIPLDLIKAIDTERKKRIGSVSRNSWILEAIVENLESKYHQFDTKRTS